MTDNAAAGKYSTRTELDIQGNQRSVTDALGRQIAAYDYDLLGNRIHQSSMEAGQRWMLNDATGKDIRSWDGRGHNRRARTTPCVGLPICLCWGLMQRTPIRGRSRWSFATPQTIYGEGQANAKTLNLCTRVFQQSDVAGLIVNMALNPTTNSARGLRLQGQLAAQLLGSSFPTRRQLTDWNGATPPLLTAWVV